MISVLFALIMVGAIITANLSLGFLGDGKMAGCELKIIPVILFLLKNPNFH
ncbi:hypothetical protein RZN22_14870 [Bacillaceae bacterium S4-13-58]